MTSDALANGVALFNRGKFFEAHEILEDFWRAAPAEQKKFLQGLVQVAVAFHHHSTGNHTGMRSVLERATRNLAENSRCFDRINLPPLLAVLNEWLSAVKEGRPVPPLPLIELSRKPEL